MPCDCGYYLIQSETDQEAQHIVGTNNIRLYVGNYWLSTEILLHWRATRLRFFGTSTKHCNEFLKQSKSEYTENMKTLCFTVLPTYNI